MRNSTRFCFYLISLNTFNLVSVLIVRFRWEICIINVDEIL